MKWILLCVTIAFVTASNAGADEQSCEGIVKEEIDAHVDDLSQFGDLIETGFGKNTQYFLDLDGNHKNGNERVVIDVGSDGTLDIMWTACEFVGR